MGLGRSCIRPITGSPRGSWAGVLCSLPPRRAMMTPQIRLRSPARSVSRAGLQVPLSLQVTARQPGGGLTFREVYTGWEYVVGNRILG